MHTTTSYPIASTGLFGHPQLKIASLITDRLQSATAVRIVSGFATLGGISAISGPLKADPSKLQTLVVGAATYPGFEALDALLTDGVNSRSLFIHLGHTRPSSGKKNPFVRYHPMLHSKIYYMEFVGDRACVFIGSHNLTSFALNGENGEASVLLEGDRNSSEFEKVRQHIDAAQEQSIVYSSDMKKALAWWSSEFLDGLKAEMRLPVEWSHVRTILIFAEASPGDRPRVHDNLYFEIPAGIEQIESLRTEVHVFLFDKLPTSPNMSVIV